MRGLDRSQLDLGAGLARVFGKGRKERLAAVWHNWQWFAKWIWSEEKELPLPAEDGSGQEADG